MHRLARRPQAPGRLRVFLAALAFVVVASPTTAHAQRERLVVRAEVLAPTAFSAPVTDDVVFPNETGLRAVQVNLAERVIAGESGSTLLLLGGQWRGVRADLPRLAAAGASTDPTTLHVLTADLWMLRTLDDRHTLVTVLRPGLYGDLGAPGEQFRLEGVAFVDRIVSDRATVGLGLSYASSFGEVLAVPVLHIVARPYRQVLVDALLPARLDVWWLPRRGLDIGVGAALTGAQYGLDGETRVGGADALQVANATVGPQIRWTPSGSKWQFTADAGTTVLRRLRYADGGNVVADLAPGNVPYVRAGVQWLF